MKSIQTIALILWMVIFIAIAFFLGQFLVSKDIFDITPIIMGDGKNQKTNNKNKSDEILEDGIVTNKVGQETVRIGLNVASDYFSEYYKDYINYIMNNIDKYSEIGKVVIDEAVASDYVFYAVSRNIDIYKYESSEENNIVTITEAEINSFVDKMFGKDVDVAFKKDGKYRYDKIAKKYTIYKINDYKKYLQELEKIENITSNEVVLTYRCKKTEGEKTIAKNTETIKLTCIYKGGRYIVTEVQV